MSDDFMSFLNSKESSKQEHVRSEQEYQDKYERTVIGLFHSIRQWMEPYERAEKLKISEAVYGLQGISRLTELTLQFNDKQKIYITPNTITQTLNTMFAVNITHSNGENYPHKQAPATRLLFDEESGWFIDLEFPNRNILTEESFKEVLKSKLK
ncbi:hypothetical protein [Paenibacillus tundrae]|uniref:hypothetical protein n=1 Tax=Paenibacillus tundrae TaxID=528187 RepID=UPI0022A98611|nr:hypothetical protein [Paenibacillus tundrae]MCZ1265396.1 hypothetical protein [Paenibacillus tundrae]